MAKPLKPVTDRQMSSLVEIVSDSPTNRLYPWGVRIVLWLLSKTSNLTSEVALSVPGNDLALNMSYATHGLISSAGETRINEDHLSKVQPRGIKLSCCCGGCIPRMGFDSEVTGYTIFLTRNYYQTEGVHILSLDGGELEEMLKELEL